MWLKNWILILAVINVCAAVQRLDPGGRQRQRKNPIEDLPPQDLSDFLDDHEYAAVLFHLGISARNDKVVAALETIDFAGKVNLPFVNVRFCNVSQH